MVSSTCVLKLASILRFLEWLVPSPPRSLYDRLKYLEDHIIYLEREYPPWAALHFNQPNRGVSAQTAVSVDADPSCHPAVAAATSTNANHRAFAFNIHCCSTARRVGRNRWDCAWSVICLQRPCHTHRRRDGRFYQRKSQERATGQVKPTSGCHGAFRGPKSDQRSYRWGCGIVVHTPTRRNGFVLIYGS